MKYTLTSEKLKLKHCSRLPNWPSIKVDTANNASSWTPPALPLDVLNICSNAVMMASDIWGASSAATFLSTLYTQQTSLIGMMVALFISNRFRPGSRKSFFFNNRSKILHSFSCLVLINATARSKKQISLHNTWHYKNPKTHSNDHNMTTETQYTSLFGGQKIQIYYITIISLN